METPGRLIVDVARLTATARGYGALPGALRLRARLTYTLRTMRHGATSESSREAHIEVRARDLELLGLLLLPLRGDA